MKRRRLSEIFRRPPRFLSFETYVDELDRPIESGPDSRHPRIVPLVVMDYGNIWARLRQLRYIGRRMLASIREMVTSAKSIQENPYLDKTTIEPGILLDLEGYAKSLGIAEIGYTRVNPSHIFKGYHILFPNAIVFTIEMDRLKIKSAPSVPSFQEIFRTYHEVGKTVNKVATFLRERGFNAQAGPAIGGDVNYVPLARDAGLGEIGKNGLLISKENGPRVRLAAVYTDIENLPFATTNPYAWIRDYCDSCNNCVKHCPADAIYQESKLLEDGSPTFVDHTKCAVPFSNDNGCTLCIKYCPFSYADHDSLKEKFERGLQGKERVSVSER